MKEYLKDGIIKTEDLKEKNFIPDIVRLKKGPAAIIECIQEIPCNPCVYACRFNAISMEDINSLPKIDFNKCNGCMECLKVCPGLAIFIEDLSKEKPRVILPYEYIPLPSRGEEVYLLNRASQIVGKGIVVFVLRVQKNTLSSLIAVEFDGPEIVHEVRNIKVMK